jgi:hypothetical protein
VRRWLLSTRVWLDRMFPQTSQHGLVRPHGAADGRAWLAATCANAARPTAQMPRRVGMEKTWSRLGIFTVALVVVCLSLLATSVRNPGRCS